MTLLRQQVAQLAPQANIRLTRAAAAQLFRSPSRRGLTLGATGGKVTASLDFVELPSEWARNVVAIIPGSDPVLKNQYVAIGAHNDHVGMRRRAGRSRILSRRSTTRATRCCSPTT